MIDGYRTAVLESNDATSYPRALRDIVNNDEGQLLVAKYNAGNVLIGVDIVDADDLDEKNSILLNAYDADAALPETW